MKFIFLFCCRKPRNSNFNDTEESKPPNCNCGKPATRLTVKKEGPNKGRTFFKCPDCNFFQFEDERNPFNERLV